MRKMSQRGTGKAKALLAIVGMALAATVLVPTSAAALPLIEGEEILFCTLINNYRAANGLPALLISTDLSEAADWHANDMATKNYFSHTDSLGRDAFTRMGAFGYSYSTWKGENIAAGNSTASGTFTQWKNSSTHNASMLNPNFKVMGIGRSYSSTSTYKYYWNNNFGGLVDAGAAPCGTSPSPSPSPAPALPAITVTDALVSEGSWFTNYARFTIRLSSTSPSTVTVNYGTANGTALAGSDYSARFGTATIYAGQTTRTISVPIVKDFVREANETFSLNLSSPVGATIGDGHGLATITNDD